ncbi:anthranilate synthase component I family protein [Sediminibacterium soli]|uniref:anthranilate synthase component I family protein n=1 Tax=Sediminibacterium soli TaxID=2698829 RepID=UPI001F18EB93|nr:anthranilate synthase component I family protein [Sediminibacterium soli]
MDNHQYSSGYHSAECLAGVGAVEVFSADTDILPRLSDFTRLQNDWLFGHLGYDLKNETEQLHSTHADAIQFPVVSFFRPQTLLRLQNGTLMIASLDNDPGELFRQITEQPSPVTSVNHTGTIQPRISKAQYLDRVQRLLQHIHRGDCYEINFCQEFFSDQAQIDPLQAYTQLTAISPNPFSCFYRSGERYLLCASPERFIRKEGNRILSQPIKGTFRRDTTDPGKDAVLRDQLLQSEKDRSENVMVVDIVRNDLSRVCTEGSVQVEELFGIYSFPQVHQMISTITGELKAGTGFTDIIKACFPMGSMTGAPKKRVMELIDQYESSNRGLYSGAVGYISPEKDFDFNVVIRSVFYNAATHYLSYWAGGGITAYSDPEKEYEECLLKAEAIRKVLIPENT